MYIGSIEASEISLVRVDGKLKYRMLILDQRNDDKGVSDPISMVLNPGSGQLFWMDLRRCPKPLLAYSILLKPIWEK